MSEQQTQQLTQDQINEYNELKSQQLEFEQFAQEFAKVQNQLVTDGRANANTIKKLGSYTSTQIKKFLETPQKYERQLREISRNLSSTNLLYKRLVDYFATISIDAPLLIPIELDKFGSKTVQIKKQYHQAARYLEMMNISKNFIQVKHALIREDIFFGLIYENEATFDFLIRGLDPDYCRLSTWEGGCYNFEFDFSFFDQYSKTSTENQFRLIMNTYESIVPGFFKSGYDKYKKDKLNFTWQEVPSEKSMCVKFNDTDYCIPYFAGSIVSLLDVEDYKQLEKTSTEQDNYKIITFKIPMNTTDRNNNKADNFAVKASTAMQFFNLAKQSLGDTSIGMIVSPLEMQQMSFKNVSNTRNKVKESIDDFYNAGGVSKLLFNAENSTSLKLSIKTDAAIVYQINRQLEAWLNRHLMRKFKNAVKVKLLDVTHFNQEELIDMYLKNCQYGTPQKTYLSALTGQTPLEMMGLNYLENEILDISNTWKPLLSSHTQSGDDDGGDGAPIQDEVTESGEITRENDSNANRVEV